MLLAVFIIVVDVGVGVGAVAVAVAVALLSVLTRLNSQQRTFIYQRLNI